MKPKDKTDKDDISLFREQMADVRRLKHDRVVPVSKRPKPIPRKTTEDEQQVIIDMMSDAYETPEVETGEELFFARNGLQQKQIRKLKRGQFAVGAELDLHGMFVPAAREALAAFIMECQHENLRCVRIIHGKGLRSKHKGPVLKNMVNKWLRQHKAVLAFCSALPVHGGTGAVYVLLKRG
jgi:DNA-nicking Smr family endonuclease